MGKGVKVMKGGSGSNAVYGLGLIGALIYFLQGASTLSDWVIGILKSIVWPAFMAYELFKFLKV